MDHPMIYGSVCSGIEAATVAWHRLGWIPSWFSEIDKFPSKVLAHHYQNVPNLGSMIGLHENPRITDLPNIKLLVGGTPCQSFSTAGLRGGLQDGRGNLALEYCRIAKALQPQWILWENVIGVLSAEEGRAFGSFLGALVKCGYGFAYRVLNAKNFGIPQGRRRLFVVGYLGDWRPAAAVLFEQESMCWNPAKSKGTKEESTESAKERSQEKEITFADVYNYSISEISPTLTASCGISNATGPKIIDRKGVRKLTLLECERLMGFPDKYTELPGARDAQRYKALGNSMAVPVMHWIGHRIQEVNTLKEKE